VATELKLSDAQKSKVKGIADDYAKDSRELFGGGGKGGFGKGGFDKDKQAENQKKIEKLRKSAMADIEEVLNADQQKAWKEPEGESCTRALHAAVVVPVPRPLWSVRGDPRTPPHPRRLSRRA
jgi:hypothetical protein